MKVLLLILAVLFELLACSLNTNAASFSIDRFTICGGGGTSTGTIYSVAGTIGQPAVGHMSGSNFSLDAGFWSIVAAVQTPGAPLLRISRNSPAELVIAWPAASVGFSLQQISVLGGTNWVAVTNAVTVVNNENQVTITSPAGARFYRLYHP